MTETHSFVAELDAEAREREAAETEFRRTMRDRVDALARERAFAHRRANVMRSLFQTVSQAETREIALAGAASALRRRLGWVDDSPAREEVLEHYQRVADAAFAATRPADTGPENQESGDAPVVLVSAGEQESGPDPRASLEAFERWYEEARGRSFWTLFEHYMPETQLVDF